MADVRDYLEASRSTDEAVRRAVIYSSQVENGEHSADELVVPLLLAAETIALAIKELGTRLDFVLRDIEQRRPR